jgi:hypothetical protein
MACNVFFYEKILVGKGQQGEICHCILYDKPRRAALLHSQFDGYIKRNVLPVRAAILTKGRMGRDRNITPHINQR